MKAVLSPLYQSLRGKLGQSAVNYPYGGRQFVRGYVIPTNPKTAMQTLVRQYFAEVSTAFSSISANERAGWDTMNADHLLTDKDGKPYKAGAKGWYTGVNTLRLMAGLAINDTAPAWTYEVGPTDISTMQVSGAGIDIDFTGIAIGKKFLIKVSEPLPGLQRAPRSFVLPSKVMTECFTTSATGGAATCHIDNGNETKSWQAGDRVVVLIQGISSGYIPGGLFAKELTITTP